MELIEECTMQIKHIWRYPVKTMGGEQLQSVALKPDGMDGERLVQVSDARGQVITSRSHPRFLAHIGTLGADGEPLANVCASARSSSASRICADVAS
jgi:uncharacterized protein YcbX